MQYLAGAVIAAAASYINIVHVALAIGVILINEAI